MMGLAVENIIWRCRCLRVDHQYSVSRLVNVSEMISVYYKVEPELCVKWPVEPANSGSFASWVSAGVIRVFTIIIILSERTPLRRPSKKYTGEFHNGSWGGPPDTAVRDGFPPSLKLVSFHAHFNPLRLHHIFWQPQPVHHTSIKAMRPLPALPR
jgi:hypothetical protein